MHRRKTREYRRKFKIVDLYDLHTPANDNHQMKKIMVSNDNYEGEYAKHFSNPRSMDFETAIEIRDIFRDLADKIQDELNPPIDYIIIAPLAYIPAFVSEFLKHRGSIADVELAAKYHASEFTVITLYISNGNVAWNDIMQNPPFDN